MSRDLTDCGAPRPILSHQRSPKPVHLTTPSPFLDNADYSEENSPRVTEGPIRCHVCAQLERQEGVALKGSSLLHKEVPTATQGKDLERFPGMPTLLSGERQEAGQAEESLKGNLILPRPPHKHFFPGVAHIWGLIWLKNFDKGC